MSGTEALVTDHPTGSSQVEFPHQMQLITKPHHFGPSYVVLADDRVWHSFALTPDTRGRVASQKTCHAANWGVGVGSLQSCAQWSAPPLLAVGGPCRGRIGTRQMRLSFLNSDE